MFFDEYIEMARYIEKERNKENNYRLAVLFNGWQLGAAGDKKTFGSYLKMFDLDISDKQEPMTKEEKKKEIAKINENIDKLFRKVKRVKRVSNARTI